MLKPSKHIVYIVLLFVSTNGLIAQNIFVSNLYNNLVFSNPSMAGINDFSIIQLNYKNHWPVDGIYNTYAASVFHHMDDYNSNIGASILHDRQYKGYLTNTTVGLNYTYSLRTGHRNYLIFGLNGQYNLQRLNYNALTFENFAPSNLENRTNHFPIINAGVTISLYEMHYIGLSIQNPVPLSEHPFAQRTLTLTYIGEYKSRSPYKLPSLIEPIAHICLSENLIDVKYGGNIGFYNFKTGILVSQTSLRLNTISFLLGINFENNDFIYVYDLNLSGAVSVNPKMAAHEVTFLRKFQYKGRRTRKGAIKCPKI